MSGPFSQIDPTGPAGPAGAEPTAGPIGAGPYAVPVNAPANPGGVRFTPPSAVKHDAGVLSQVLVFAVGALTFAGLGLSFDDADITVFAVVTLTVGVALGLALDLRAFFARVPGALLGLGAVLLAFFGWVLVSTQTRSTPNPGWLLLVGLFALGLDWRWVERLRPLVAASALLVIPLIGVEQLAALPLALGWFVLAVTAYWSFQRDLVRTSPHLQPVAGYAAPRPVNTSVDLVRIGGLALIGALALALFIGNPSCSPTRSASSTGGAGSSAGGSFDPRDPSGSGSGSGSGSTGSGSTGSGSSGSGSSGSGSSGSGTGSGSAGSGSGSSGSGSSSGGGSGSGSSGGGSTRSGATGSASSGASGTTGSATQPPDFQRAGLILLALLVVAAAFAAAFPFVRRWLRAPAQPRSLTWAQATARRLEDEGRARGRVRQRGETVPEYAAALGGSTLADPDLVAVGELVSAALFGPHEPPAEARTWAQDVFDRAVEANPVPTAAERRRGRRTAGPGDGPAPQPAPA